MADLPEPMKPYLIIIGVNATGKAFGSMFSEAEAELAERAAGQMDMEVIRVEGDELAALAADLPRGKLFEKSGNAFVPLMAMAKYERLKTLAEAAGTLSKPPRPESATTLPDGAAEGAGDATGGGGEGNKLAYSNVPSSWQAITLGSLVLMREEGEQEGWYDAVVTGVASAEDPDAQLTLRYVEFIDYPAQVRRRTELALLPPSLDAQ